MYDNPIIKTQQYPKRIRPFMDVNLKVTSLKGPYIGNQLDYEMKCWSSKCAVLVRGPTGCGKTTFILEKLLRYAKIQCKNILIVANRNTLNLAYKKRLAEITGVASYYTDEGLICAVQFDNVYVVNYQGFTSFCKQHKHIKFSYIVMDECHYFLSDAGFNSSSGEVLDMIPMCFKDAVRIYISATLEEITPYIIRAELYDYEIWDDIVYEKLTDYPICNVRLGELFSGYHNIPFPEMYILPESYDRIELNFFDDAEQLMMSLDAIESKTLVFTDSIERGKKLKAMVSSARLISSEILADNPHIAKELIETEKFEEKFLITTSVFCNGNNIKDTKVENVVTFPTDKTEILQMAGRRRINHASESDSFSLFIYVPSLSELNYRIQATRELLEEIENCKKSEIHHLDVIKNDIYPLSEQIRNITTINLENRKYQINYLSEDKLYMQLKHLEKIKYLISNYGKTAYCKEIAEWFDEEYSPEMWFYTEDDKLTAMLDFVKMFPKVMNRKEFVDFSRKVTEKRISLFGKTSADNTGKKRKPLGHTALNNRFKEIELPVAVSFDDETYFIDIDEIKNTRRNFYD